MKRATKAVIDSQALRKNLEVVRSKAPRTKILAMIKADGYGHGIVRVAQILQSADALGVACLEEALELRAAEITNRIVWMQGFSHRAAEQLPILYDLQIEPVIHQFEQIEALQQFSKNFPDKKFRVWMKINTGMNRLGFAIEDAHSAWHKLNAIPSVQVETVLTHFAKADEPTQPETTLQQEAFFKLVHTWPVAKSLANSAAILAYPSTHADWVRPGIMLYGVSPFAESQGSAEGLQPVMGLYSELIAIQSVPKT